MQVEITKKGIKEFRFEERPIQVDGGFEDTKMVPCGTRGCENRFEARYPEPGEPVVIFCPDCIEDRELDARDPYDFDPYA